MAFKPDKTRFGAKLTFYDASTDKTIVKTYSGLNPIADDIGGGTSDLKATDLAYVLTSRYNNYFWNRSANNKLFLGRLLAPRYSVTGVEMVQNTPFIATIGNEGGETNGDIQPNG